MEDAAAPAAFDLAQGVPIPRGYFDTTPSRLTYELDFLRDAGEWKPIKLNVKIKPPSEMNEN